MKTAIIILNYNDHEQTIDCVKRLLSISVSADIYVVDNCSTDGSYEVMRNGLKNYDGVYICKSTKNGGYSYGNNYGIHYAENRLKYEYFCIMNPDVILATDYLNELCRKLESTNEYAIISSLMIYPDRLDLAKISWDLRTPKQVYRHHFLLNHDTDKTFRHSYKYIGDGFVEVDAVPGSFFIIKSQDLKRIGYLDEGGFLYNEESMLAFSIRKLGKKMLLSLNHHYIHDHVYKTSNEEVWHNYKCHFDKVLAEYQITYKSRLYLCEHYYDSKYIARLKIINLFNMCLLRLKHVIAVLFH